VRVVDYKTGKAPRPEYAAEALFQMKFYALVLWRLRGRMPRRLQLVYLGSGEILRYEPDEADLRALVGEVAGGLGGGPAEDEGRAVDERRLGELAEGVLVVGDVDHGEEDAQLVFALEVLDARVDVLGVEAVVLEARSTSALKLARFVGGTIP
jgi:hypothetical protein